MCAGAIVLARIPWVVWGVDDPQRGGARSLFNIFNHPRLNHRPTVLSGVLEEECRAVLVDFFRRRRREVRPGDPELHGGTESAYGSDNHP